MKSVENNLLSVFSLWSFSMWVCRWQLSRNCINNFCNEHNSQLLLLSSLQIVEDATSEFYGLFDDSVDFGFV